MVHMDLTVDIVMKLMCQIHSGAGPGATVSVILYNWRLHFGKDSSDLWKIFAGFMECLANNRPPWAVYWYLMTG